MTSAVVPNAVNRVITRSSHALRLRNPIDLTAETNFHLALGSKDHLVHAGTARILPVGPGLRVRLLDSFFFTYTIPYY